MTDAPSGSLHEHSFNIGLSDALKEQYASWRAEERDFIQAERQGGVVSPHGRRGRADILISAREMSPVAIEVTYENDPDPDSDAARRIGSVTPQDGRVIEAAIVVLAPLQAKQQWHDHRQVYTKLVEDKQLLNYAVFSSNAEGGHERWPSKGYIEGSVTDLAALAVAVSVPQHKIDTLVAGAAGSIHALAKLINSEIPEYIQQEIAKELGQSTDPSTLLDVMTVAVCIWVNTMVMYSKIALVYTTDGEGYTKILPLDRLDRDDRGITVRSLLEAWEKILEIDYGSIFRPAYKSLAHMPVSTATSDTICRLERISARITNVQFRPIIDIGGELFPKVAANRKETAAFYTLANSAELLACLSLPLDIEGFDFEKAVIGDLACGTGTLLRAAYRRIREHLERRKVDPRDCHKRWMEEGLYGMDVQPIATHLTAAGLTAMEIDCIYDKANIACFSARDGKTGSLEFFEHGSVRDLFGGEKSAVPDSRTGEEGRGVGKHGYKVTIASADFFDLCIMNPPYSRTRGGQRVFDLTGLSDEDRQKSQKRVGEMLQGRFGDMKAGLGSAFAALADMKLKDRGIYASVLPLTAACAGSWAKFRSHILSRYDDIFAIGMASEKPESFSADTSINEMLLVGRKCKQYTKLKNSILFVNLYRPPKSIADAQEIARQCNQLNEKKERSGYLRIGKDYIGEWLRLSIEGNLEQPWGAVGARSAQLCLAAFDLYSGKLRGAGEAESALIDLPTITLEKLFVLGPTHDLIGHPDGGDGRGAFEFKPLFRGDVPIRPSLWRADSQTQCSILVSPTDDGMGMYGRASLQNDMWKKASRWFWSRNMRFTSQALQCAYTKKRAMGGRAWISLTPTGANTDSVFHATALWGNSIFGLIVRWWHSQRTQQGRATAQVKDTGRMPIPNFGAKTEAGERARKIASASFESCLSLSLSPAGAAAKDEARHRIDAITADMLGIPRSAEREEKLDRLRQLWCREPSVHGGNKKLLENLEL